MSQIQELRGITDAGFMDCKKALVECDGDIQKAIDYLREKGIAKGAKRGSKIAAEGLVESYIHAGGSVGVLVEVNCETDFAAKSPKFKELVHDIALHIAASAPLYVAEADVPQDVIDKEKEILRAQALEEGKPEKIVDKMVEGRIKTYYQDNCLLCQKFVKNPDQTVADLIASYVGSIGEKIVVRRFVRFVMGEGIEKKTEDFAEEVAKQMNINK